MLGCRSSELGEMMYERWNYDRFRPPVEIGLGDIYYFREKNERDFLIKDKGKITSAFQACYELPAQ